MKRKTVSLSTFSFIFAINVNICQNSRGPSETVKPRMVTFNLWQVTWIVVNCIFVFLQMYLNIWTIRAIFHFKGVSQLGRQPDGCGLSICSTVLPLWQILPNGIADDFFKKQDFLHSSSVIKRETGVLAVGWGWCQDFLQHQMFWWFCATTRLGDDTFQSFDPMKHWLDGCALKVDLGVTYFQVAHDTSQFYTSARQENMWSFFFLIFQHPVFHGHMSPPVVCLVVSLLLFQARNA